MVDKVARFQIELGGDDSDISAVLSSLKGKFRSTVSDLEASTKNVQLFKGVSADVEKANIAFTAAKQKVEDLVAAISSIRAASGQANSGLGLEKELKIAQRELSAATREADKQATSLTKLEARLAAAGVNTKDLANEETRLAKEASSANRALLEQAQKGLLGFKGLSDIRPQVQELNTAFRALRDSGKLSFGELSIAEAKLSQGIGNLRQSTGGLGAALSDIRGKVLAFTIAFAGITAGVFTAARNFRDFEQQVAAVESIADVSRAKVDQLAQGVRDLAKAMGVDAVKSTHALYEIIASGIPEDNALTVLAAASKAAIAGLTDVDTAARIGVSVLNGYGLEVSKLDHVYDVLFQTVRDGIVTFEELAKNIGQVIPAARAAHVPLEQLGAAMVVLTRQGIDAPEAATAINRAIIDLSAPAPQARDALRDLGIELNGLFGVIEQLSKKKLTISQLQQIVPDVRATRAVLALANNFRLLSDQIGTMNTAAGTAERAYLKLANTPQQQVRKFEAAIKDLGISIGEFITKGSAGFLQSLTGIVNAFNALGPSTKNTVVQFAAVTAGVVALTLIARTLATPLNLLVGALATSGTSAFTAAGGFTAASVAAGTLNVAIAGLLGFKLGEQLRENFSGVRTVGDLLGTLAGSAANLTEFGLARLQAALTGNSGAADVATRAFQRNRDILRGQWDAAISGATERLRQLDAEQVRLTDQLAKTSQAASDTAGKTEQAISRIAAEITTELAGVDTFISHFQASLTALSAGLQQAVQQIQAGVSSSIGSINAQAAAQIAALDTLRNSELSIAQQTLAIQQQAAADRLAVLTRGTADVLKAFEAEAAARLEVARRTGQDIAKVELDLAIARRAILQTQVDALRAHVNELIGQETAYLNRVKDLDQQRFAFNQTVEDKLFAIRLGGLSVFDQYYAKVGQIDKALSDGRKALARGDAAAAEEYAKRAIELAGNVEREVKEGERTVVSAMTAQATAVGKIKEAQQLVNEAFEAQGGAAKRGAVATANALKDATEELGAVKTKLDDISQKIAAGIELSITGNTKAVESTIAKLDEQIEKRDRIVQVKANIDLALVETKRLKAELVDATTVNVKARTDEIDKSLKAIADAKPELKVLVDKAVASIGDVIAAAAEIDKVRHEIDVNADKARKEIDSLNGRNTKSTHTIKIVVDRSGVPSDVIPAPEAFGFARGGPIGWALERQDASGVPVQRFARGGGVFRTPSWQKVPGSGNGDTVPAALQAGSFVVRKAAAKHYGDVTMGHLAHYALGGIARFATGGDVTGQNTFLKKDPFLGQIFLNSQGKQVFNQSGADDFVYAGDVHAPIREGGEVFGPPKLPSDEKEKIRAILRYVSEVKTAALVDDFFFWEKSLKVLEKSLRLYEQQPTDDNLELVLRFARNIGLNLGHSKSDLQGFDVDGRRWHKTYGQVFSNIPPGLAGLGNTYDFFARGGKAAAPPGDTVPAMLTPGEWVMNPRSVRHFGAGLMHAINTMRVPRAALAGMLAVTAPAPAVAHFATGGPVGDVGLSSTARLPDRTGAGTTNNFNISVQKLDEKEFRRSVVPMLDKLERRKGKG